MKRRFLTSTTVLVLLNLLPGCSKDESAPPPATGCVALPDDVSCQRASGECVPLQCIDDYWGCAPGESIIALAPGRCTSRDAGTDAGDG